MINFDDFEYEEENSNMFNVGDYVEGENYKNAIYWDHRYGGWKSITAYMRGHKELRVDSVSIISELDLSGFRYDIPNSYKGQNVYMIKVNGFWPYFISSIFKKQII